MKSRKNDLRTSRKSGATEVGLLSRDSAKSLRSLRSVPKSDSRSSRTKAGPDVRNRSSGKESSNRIESTSTTDPSSVGVVNNASDNEYKRRRVDTTGYIKRRFLYDVAEAPKRLQRKAKSQRSTAALMAASSAKLSQRRARHSDTKITKNLAPKMNRIIRDGEDSVEMNAASIASKPRNFDLSSLDRKMKRSSSQITSIKRTTHPHSSWDFPDIFEYESPNNSDFTENGDSDYGISSVACNKNPTAEYYSSTISRDLYGGRDKRIGTNRSRHPSNQGGKRSREAIPANKKSEAFIAQSFFSTDRSPTESPYPDDIVSFCPNRTTRRNGKPKQSDMDFTDGFSTSSHSPVLSDRQIQPPIEDLEEELLAPELSILTATTCLASADGSLFTTFPQSSGFLTGAGGVGSSRRKSPVRPMQVLRTKAPTPANSTSAVPFGCSRDLNSPSNQPLKNGRRINIDNRTDDGLSVSYQPLDSESTNIDLCLTSPQGFQSTSVLRLATPNLCNKATSIAIRPVHDRSHKPDDKPGSIDDNDKVSVSGTSLGSKTSRSGKAVLAKSLLLAHNATASRRRPSILRRSSGTPKAEPEEENPKPVSRTIGAFTPRSSRRSGKVSTDSTGPTKLLQLITATSLSSSNLTASEKLFGRRSGSQKQSLVTNVTMPVTESRYVDSIKTPVATPTSCRYAVLRGSANGKRYIVLGNNAIFDRSRCAKKNITPTVAPPTHTSVETPGTDSHSLIDVHPMELTIPGSLMDDSRESLGRFSHSIDPESDSSQPLAALDINESDPVSALIAT